MRPLLVAFALFLALFGQTSRGQTYTISLFAGGGLPINTPGISTNIDWVSAVAADAAGNLFIASDSRNVVLRLDAATGVLTLAAGNGVEGFSGDGGPAAEAQLKGPTGVAVDSAGNLYIADTGNNRVRKVFNGVITTVAGRGVSLDDNIPATSAIFAPSGIAVDAAGNLYIGDHGPGQVHKVSNGVITTVAGTRGPGLSGEGVPATRAQLAPATRVIGARGQSLEIGTLLAIAVDKAGNLYIADTQNNRVREVSNGVITTVAGNGTPGFSGDNGPATSAQLSHPTGVAMDAAGNLYIADQGNSRIRRVSNGVIATVAGNGLPGFSGDGGAAASAQLSGPTGIAVDLAGNLYIADTGNKRIRKVSNGVITTVAGNGDVFSFSGDGGPAASAQFANPDGVAVDSAGHVYIADASNMRVRGVSGGEITTVAGDGTPGFGGDDGPATSAQLGGPFSIAVDPAGNLYIYVERDCRGNMRIRKVSNGVITTVVGNRNSGCGAIAVSAIPIGIAVDSAGGLYVAEPLNNRVRKISNGAIITVAGNGTRGFSGDGGPATSAQLNFPSGIAVDSAGNLYIADYFNNRIRKVSNGVITTVAGNGTSGGDNGPATSAQLPLPRGIAADSAGNLYIADGIGVRKVSNGVIATIARSPTSSPPGDRDFNAVAVDSAVAVAVDSAGKVYVVGNNRVFLLTPEGANRAR